MKRVNKQQTVCKVLCGILLLYYYITKGFTVHIIASCYKKVNS